MWNAISLVQGLNSCCCVHFLRQKPLHHGHLLKLRHINKNFPAQPQNEIAATKNVQKATEDMLAPCDCPTRSPCPPVPDTFPFPAISEYHEELENWIKCYFANSAFNTCTHQKLQIMAGKPLSISFLDNCQPVVVHKPIPVHHHLKEAVKSQLDADVALNIIEPVPSGTPTAWCFQNNYSSQKRWDSL